MWRTPAFGLVVVAFSAQVKAVPSRLPECVPFRQNIIDMENTSVRRPRLGSEPAPYRPDHGTPTATLEIRFQRRQPESSPTCAYLGIEEPFEI